MGTVTPINVVEISALILGGALLRYAVVRYRGGKVPASKRELEAIKAALGSQSGRVVRASRELQGQPFSNCEHEGLGRLYHVTLQDGGVTIRRRVVLRTGAAPTLLP